MRKFLIGACVALIGLSLSACERVLKEVNEKQNTEAQQPEPISYTIEQIIPDSFFVIRVIGKDGHYPLSVSSTLAAGLRELSRTYTLEARSIKTLQDNDSGGSPYTEGLIVSVTARKQ